MFHELLGKAFQVLMKQLFVLKRLYLFIERTDIYLPEKDTNYYLTKLHDIRIVRYYFFVLLGGGGAVTPFLNLFLSRQNLDGVQIGWILAIGSMITLFAAPIWTRVHSETGRPLVYLQISLILTAAVTIFLCYQTAFIWLAVFYAIRVLFSAGHLPVSDILALQVTDDTSEGYGSVRVWGSFGWAVIVLGTGWIIQQTTMKSAFFLFSFFMLTGAFLLSQIRIKPKPVPAANRINSSGYLKLITKMLKSPSLAGVSVMLIIIGIANLGIAQFETLYLDELGAKESLIGIAGMVSSAIEVPGMLWTDRLIRRRKPVIILMIGLVMFCFLRLLVFLFPSVFMIIFTRAAGGIAFSFYTVALIKCISLQTRANETGTVLVILTVIIPSIVNIIFTPIAGFAYDRVGVHRLYILSLAGYALGTLVLLLSQKKTGKRAV